MRSKYFKVLSIVLLSLIGVMAASASPAQAEWLLLENAESVLLLNLVAEVLLGEILSNGIEIHCESSEASVQVFTFTGHETAFAWIYLEPRNCEVLENGFCQVSFIPKIAEGKLEMDESGNVFAKVSAERFGTFLFTGAFCTLPEEEELSGTALVTILNPLKDQATHLVQLDEAREGEKSLLTLGESEAEIHGELEFEPKPFVLAHVSEAFNSTWAIHLANL